ncbi:MAG: manganese efflux pump MntP family protein [Mariniphaga sp.]|nr:manganese efflux pump MntP family protein [Mariniphaga sp.]MDD4225404.1 manganese efflux pump MntP family protein [Mariniphaga sp.]MDD4424313.1 manganese efflux pump MntP family protein [Mariniphaga sp.]
MSLALILTYVLVGIGLSFDSFAVSVSYGVMRQDIRFKQAIPVAFSLAFFQGVFPLIGWIAGTSLKNLISSIDHWVAFGLLFLIGMKMIVEGVNSNETLKGINPYSFRLILSLSVATSIDALVVGLSFGVLKMPILLAVIIIGAVTFIASMLGMFFGKKISPGMNRVSFILGGIILIGMGIKILLEHTL